MAFAWDVEAARWNLYDLRGPANQHAGAPAHELTSHLLARLQQAGPPPPHVDADDDADADVDADEAQYDEQPWAHLALDPFDDGFEDGPF